MRSIVKLTIGMLLLRALSACTAVPNEPAQDEGIWGLDTSGHRVKIDPLKICWSTFDAIPPGVEAVPDPTHHRFIYRPLEGASATHPSDKTGATPNVIIPPDIGCTCECSTGHCNPALLGKSCVCIIEEGCTTCTKTSNPPGGT